MEIRFENLDDRGLMSNLRLVKNLTCNCQVFSSASYLMFFIYLYSLFFCNRVVGFFFGFVPKPVRFLKTSQVSI